MSFESSHRYERRFDGLAVYCSDGRFGAACSDFLHNSLNLTNCDRLVLPGGAGALVEHGQAVGGQAYAWDSFKFLVEAHEIARVVLIAHGDCMYYATRISHGEAIEPHQTRDLRRAHELVCTRLPALTVEAYFARQTDAGRIRFEPVALG